MTVELLTVVNVLIVILNLGVLGLTMKLYTEYAKDRFIQRKVKNNDGSDG